MLPAAVLLAALGPGSARAQTAAALLPIAARPAAAPRVRKATPEETKAAAQELERRLSVLHAQLAQENAEFDRASLDLAGIASWFESAAPGSPEAERLRAELERVVAKYPKAPLILEMTIAARRLQVYKETGELPADIPDREEIRLLLENPWKDLKSDPRTEVVRAFALEKDIGALTRQIDRFNRLPEPQAAKKAAPQALPEAAPAPKPPAKAGRPPELARDDGAGRAETDPVPELIGLLSSPDARRRALAADELGGSAGRPEAAAALRRALSDRDARVRASAALALGGATPEAGLLAELRALLQDPGGEVRFSARRALERLGHAP